MRTFGKTLIVVLCLAAGAVAAQDNKGRKTFPLEPTERLALAELTRRSRELDADLSAVLNRARKDRPEVSEKEVFGFDPRTGVFYSELPAEVAPVPTASITVPAGATANISSDTPRK